MELLAACASGSCTVREPLEIDASNWDKTCTADEDCAIVHEGEVCSSCVCGGTAVNVAEITRYEELTEDVECTPGPDFCDCPIIEEAWCNDGICEPGRR